MVISLLWQLSSSPKKKNRQATKTNPLKQSIVCNVAAGDTKWDAGARPHLGGSQRVPPWTSVKREERGTVPCRLRKRPNCSHEGLGGLANNKCSQCQDSPSIWKGLECFFMDFPLDDLLSHWSFIRESHWVVWQGHSWTVESHGQENRVAQVWKDCVACFLEWSKCTIPHFPLFCGWHSLSNSRANQGPQIFKESKILLPQTQPGRPCVWSRHLNFHQSSCLDQQAIPCWNKRPRHLCWSFEKPHPRREKSDCGQCVQANWLSYD